MSDLTQYFSVELYSEPKQLDDKIGNIHKECKTGQFIPRSRLVLNVFCHNKLFFFKLSLIFSHGLQAILYCSNNYD